MKYLATFHTHFDAMKYTRFLKLKGIRGTLRPVPRRVSSSCGTCAVFETEALSDSALEAFTREDVEALYLIEGEAHTQIFQDSCSAG